MSPPLPPEVLEQLGLDEHCCEEEGRAGHEATMTHEPRLPGTRGRGTHGGVELCVLVDPDVASMLDLRSLRLSEPGRERLSRNEIAAAVLSAWAHGLREGDRRDGGAREDIVTN